MHTVVYIIPFIASSDIQQFFVLPLNSVVIVVYVCVCVSASAAH